MSARYPLVEAATAVLFAAAAVATGWSWTLPVVLYLVAVGVALTLIDIDVRRLPDAIVLPSYPVVAALLVLAAWNPGGASDWPALGRAAVGGAAMLTVYLVTFLAYPAGMGLGDVKLSGVLGMFLGFTGWGALVVGWFAAYVLGAAVGVALMASGRATRRSGIPFGPWMILGALVGAVAGEALWSGYLGLL